MNESVITELIESVSGKLERRNENLSTTIDAWLGVLDTLGLAWAIKDADDASHFRLNAAAQQDLGDLPVDVVHLSVPRDRELLLSEPWLLLWKPKCEQQGADISGLSQRELEVRDWMLQGKTLDETSMILGISPRTVEKHRQNIKQKLS
ncbi:MAG: helix-turn-helix transcriptional regulator [Opitutaceae bacterium]